MCKGENDLLGWKSFRERKSQLKLGIIALIYGMVVVSIVGFSWPQIRQAQKLEKLIADETEQIQLLERRSNQRSVLESELAVLTQSTTAYEQIIPKAVNLTEILQWIRELVAVGEVELVELGYLPLRSDGQKAWYPMRMEISGQYGDIIGVFKALYTALPTIQFQQVSIASDIDASVNLVAEFDLNVIPPAWESEIGWQWPVHELTLTTVNPMGVPLTYLNELFWDNLKLLGVIKVHEGEHRALVAYNGTQAWKKAGEPLEIGTIVEIDDAALVLEVHGVKLRIKLGGNQNEP